MFPTLSSLINYLLGTSFEWSVPTFGFFVTLAFFLSFLVFRMELKRKEEIGEIKAFYEHGNGSMLKNLQIHLSYALFGFLLGFKVSAWISLPDFPNREPFNFLFSTYGNWKWGLAISMLFLLMVTFFLRNEKQNNEAEPSLVHPYQLAPKMLLFCAIFGFIGAKLFNIVEDWNLHRNFSFVEILRFSGLTFYGGLVFGGITYFVIGMRKGIPWRSLADIGGMGMLVAYGVGRMGCHMSGDGDWGIVNNRDNPWSWFPDNLWAFNFPNNVIQQGVVIPGCTGKYCMVLPEPVYPTSAYESILILLVFIVLMLFRNKLNTPGLLASIFFIVIGLERLLIEFIRVNYKFDMFGLKMSQAQMISVILILLGTTTLISKFTRK